MRSFPHCAPGGEFLRSIGSHDDVVWPAKTLKELARETTGLLRAGFTATSDGPPLSRLIQAFDHRLAVRKSVSVEDLGDEEVARMPSSFPAALADAIVPPRTPTGRPIRRTHLSRSIHETLSLVQRARERPHPRSPTSPASLALSVRPEPAPPGTSPMGRSRVGQPPRHDHRGPAATGVS